jgi:hypothetical protein
MIINTTDNEMDDVGTKKLYRQEAIGEAITNT